MFKPCSLLQVTALAQQRFDALAGVGGLGDLGLSALGSAQVTGLLKYC
jgi:hypothetical protein